MCEYKCDVLTGLHHEGIFRVPGSQTEVNHIRDAFERGMIMFKWMNTRCIKIRMLLEAMHIWLVIITK